MASSIDRVKQYKQAMIGRYGRSEDITGLTQVVTTLVPLALCWCGAIMSAAESWWLTAAAVLLITLLTLRVFALMHECGHGSLFRSRSLNRAAGFLLGVVAGMPQHVWSKHHSYHHAHNGNWEKYRGPYTTLSVDEYESLTASQQRMYRLKCSIAMAPLAGFIYLIFSPRFNWMRITIGLVLHVIPRKAAHPEVSLREHAASYQSRHCKSAREYWHMFWNNIVLLSIWALMCWVCGSALFFTIYLLSVSIAGGIGIVLFNIQHNFEHSYASDSKLWDLDTGAIEGTSFLLLPGWLNWVTANIGYHHIHHLSASIPNYSLVACHEEFQHLFADVVRVTLPQVHQASKCILWDTRARRIISVAEYQRRTAGRQHSRVRGAMSPP
jgi:acyl-lipid omega-6 desaturase (Delta-12 desaturase)